MCVRARACVRACVCVCVCVCSVFLRNEADLFPRETPLRVNEVLREGEGRSPLPSQLDLPFWDRDSLVGRAPYL